MKLSNINQVRSEDYSEDYEDLVDQLGETLNPFMQEVYELSENRIDFENRVEVLKSIEITVDANGKPTLNDKVNTGKSSINGTHVIRAINLTNTSIYPTTAPFISFTPLGSGLVRIDHISGLPANSKFSLNIVFY